VLRTRNFSKSVWTQVARVDFLHNRDY